MLAQLGFNRVFFTNPVTWVAIAFIAIAAGSTVNADRNLTRTCGDAAQVSFGPTALDEYYVQPLDNAHWGGNWTFEGRLRFYTQTKADFYQDIFPRADFANFMARDKELATYTAYTLGVNASYEFKIERFPWLSKSSLNLRYDHMTVNYDDFRDARFSFGSFGALPDDPFDPGKEPLYKLDADIYQFYISAFF